MFTNEYVKIENLQNFLKDHDTVIIRTNHINAGWHDVEFEANRAGYGVYRFINEDLPSNKFQECYKFFKKE